MTDLDRLDASAAATFIERNARRMDPDLPPVMESHEEVILYGSAGEFRAIRSLVAAVRERDDLRAAPCRYCGSLNGETPQSAYAWDPLTGEMLRKAIAEACSLTNPRLNEVEWDDVAAILPPAPTGPDDELLASTAEACRDAVSDATNRLIVVFRRFAVERFGSAPTEGEFRLMLRAALHREDGAS